MRVGQTLMRGSKGYGLPDLAKQTSAVVLYEQSKAKLTNLSSVVLHDPLREKSFALVESGGLSKIPASALTTVYQGKTYFQALPPSLRSRFFYDANRPSAAKKGAIVLAGALVEEIAGEDYLNLNVLSDDDVAALKGLVSGDDGDFGNWGTPSTVSRPKSSPISRIRPSSAPINPTVARSRWARSSWSPSPIRIPRSRATR
jgi:hypothetical protein